MKNPPPQVPETLHPLAREILEILRGDEAAHPVILGGGVALQHYCPFRGTRDIDAWWDHAPEPKTEAAIEAAMGRVARTHGYTVAVRKWGETQSYELAEGGRTLFSFQISLRTRALDPALPSTWSPVRIETFRDNLGAKMNAVVSRGAPRDFLDVFEVCLRGLATPGDCWALWEAKNPGESSVAARANVAHHLEALEARRPLGRISSEEERARAAAVRRWVRETLCREAPGGRRHG